MQFGAGVRLVRGLPTVINEGEFCRESNNCQVAATGSYQPGNGHLKDGKGYQCHLRQGGLDDRAILT